jgi:hypothetical protein
MSWDIYVQDLPAGIASTDDIPDDFRPGPLGSRTPLIAKIVEVVPGADFSDPSWGRIEGPGFSIEVNMGDSEECEGFAFHVRGDDVAAGVVADILERLGLQAIDPQSPTHLFSRETAAGSLAAWRAYRDRVIG